MKEIEENRKQLYNKQPGNFELLLSKEREHLRTYTTTDSIK